MSSLTTIAVGVHLPDDIRSSSSIHPSEEDGSYMRRRSEKPFSSEPPTMMKVSPYCTLETLWSSWGRSGPLNEKAPN